MTDPPVESLRSNELLSRSNSRLLIVDMQQKLLQLIPDFERTVRNCRRLIEGAGILQVPVFATEQYPKGLGGTNPELAALLPEIPSKQRFSCAEVLAWGAPATFDDERDQVVIAGIEGHVCVLQTALDLIAHGFRVFIVADAVASRHPVDYRFALDRMAASGATITTTESVLFEWCETSAIPEFKQISRLVIDG